ncbi:MAG: methyltransferase domain-containing protein [Halioglobus sp.]|nr:methyltransferase domain-containing protein [Halioglobus sp.]
MIDSSFATVNCPVDSIPLADRSFDAIGSLAGLHHIANRSPVFSEWSRQLKAGGELAVADVALGSVTGDFLNGFVDCHTPQGHDGIFLQRANSPS